MFRCVSIPSVILLTTVVNLSSSSLKESSEIAIRLFHVSSSSKEKLIGAVVVAAKELINVTSDPIRTLCQMSHFKSE
jgi:hypothetical protein